MNPKPKNPAAVALGKLSRINPTEAQKAASRANGLLGAAHGAKGGRPRKDNPEFSAWYEKKIGISLEEARGRGVSDLGLMQEAFEYGMAAGQKKPGKI